MAAAENGGGRRIAWVVAPVVVFAAIAILFAFALRGGDPSTLPSALMGKPAPDVQFPALGGVTRAGKPVPGIGHGDLARGKVTIVNFWASWCAPCILEHPYLMELSKRSDIQIFGVNYKDAPPRGAQFIARHGNPFARLGADVEGRGAIEWGVYGMPETFVVDGRGRIVYKHVGPIDEKVLRNKLLPIIAQAGASQARR